MKKDIWRTEIRLRYIVTLTDDKIQELKKLIQKGRKGYRIKHAQILLKLDHRPGQCRLVIWVHQGSVWDYCRDCQTFCNGRDGSRPQSKKAAEQWSGTERQKSARSPVWIRRKVSPAGQCKAIAEGLIRLEVVDYITDSTICNIMKKRGQAMARKRMMYPKSRNEVYGRHGGCL